MKNLNLTGNEFTADLGLDLITKDRYQSMVEEMDEAWELRIKASLEEASAGQVRRGMADELIREIFSTD